MDPVDREFWIDCADDDLQTIFRKLLSRGYSREESIEILASGELVDVLLEEREIEIAEQKYEGYKKNFLKLHDLKCAADAQFFRANIEKWGDCFVACDALHVHAVFLNNEYQNDLRSILSDEVKKETNFLHYSLMANYARACQIYAEIFCLLKNGFANGAFARWRSLFELLVVSEFLMKCGEETAKAYLYSCNNAKEKYEWAKTAACFKNLKSVQFSDLRKEVEIAHDFVAYEEYSLSHKMVHASPFGIFNGVGVRENDAGLYDGPSHWGLAGPAILTVRVFAVLSGLYFMQYDITKWRAIGESFVYWVKDITDNFVKQAEINGDLDIVDEFDDFAITR
ncbi:hypothetical protein L21_0358 [Methanoculleus chikugoensis]|uniref:Uncharacterized protein n=1 Tax=Methanoculleus chikugoensis TaxID=118126 RepID=A0A1M4MHS9_9EURY|nr:DUF5677 domain-containing protein [Methanoculleus chikugoensis]SCL74479.1 hypothetical protein L21_0358 [Methanoculleus chikugoensis]